MSLGLKPGPSAGSWHILGSSAAGPRVAAGTDRTGVAASDQHRRHRTLTGMPASPQPVIPTWTVPPAHEIHDLLTLAAHYGRGGDEYARGCADAAQWVTGWPDIQPEDVEHRVDESVAEARAGDPAAKGQADTLMWLVGFNAVPIELPHRNPDGTLVTADQLYDTASRGMTTWTAEDRQRARDTAERAATRSRHLADLG